MGIQGLLPLLKDIQHKTNARTFRGQAAGIDAYCWLHKGAYGCATDLVAGRKTTVYINYILRRVNMLLHFNIQPILVFDGGYLPAKREKEKERRMRREESLKKAKAFLRAGNKVQAVECFQRAVNITPAMASEVIAACRAKNVQCIVAPYEADAQLAYLYKQGITQFTITEDSDLLLYGCEKIMFKMNVDGDGMFIDLAELNKVRTVALESFTMEKFRHMCILSGCDYLPSIKGLGLYKAHKYMKRSSDVFKAIQTIRNDPKMQVPEDYEESVRRTDAVFKYQLVFDPRTRQLVHLNNTSVSDDVSEEDLKFAGPPMSEAKALKIALGNLDPISGEELADFSDFTNLAENKQQNQQKSQGWLSTKRHVSHDDSVDSTPVSIETTKGFEERGTKKDLSKAMAKSDMTSAIKIISSRPVKRRRQSDDDQTTSYDNVQKSYLGVKDDEKDISLADVDMTSSRTKADTSTSLHSSRHHSVFGKKFHHKFKNPFRVHEDDSLFQGAPTVSGYFGRGKDTDDEIDKENESADPLKNPSEPLQFQESSHKNENIKLSKFDNLSPPTKRTKFSFINFLDGQTKQSLADTSRTMTQNDEGVSHKITTDTTENKNLTTNDTKSLTVKERQPLSPKKIEQCQSSNQSNNDRISNVSVYNNKLNSKKISLAGRKSSTPTILQQFQRHKKVLKSTSPCNKELEDKEDTIEKVENREDKNPPEVNSSCSESNEFYREDHSVDNDNIVETKEEDKSVDGIKKKTSTIESMLNNRKSRLPGSSLPKSSVKESRFIGRCKTVGLSRRSKSSLDKIKQDDTKLTQLRIGFQKFAFAKKSVNWASKESDRKWYVCLEDK